MTVAHGYVDVGVVKAQVDLVHPANTVPLELAVGAASRAIDDATGRRFWKDTEPSARVFDPTNADRAWINDFLADEDVTVKTDEDNDGTFETTWLASEFQIEPLNAAADELPGRAIYAVDGRRFPTCRRRTPLQVTATWGWPAIPKQVEQACVLITMRLFMRPQAPFGVIGGTPEVAAVKLARDPDVRALLDPFDRRIGFA